MALWELDRFQGARFLGFIRSVPIPEGFSGQDYLPNQDVYDLDFEYIQGTLERPVMASVMTWDAEAPIAGRPALGPKVQGELPPIKRKARISEKEIIRFLTPRANTPDVQTAIDYVYDLTRRQLDAVQARVEWLRMRALANPTLLYDPGEGVVFELDYAYNKKFLIDLDSGLDANSQAVTGLSGFYWSDHVNADPVGDLGVICDLVQTITGFRPARGIWSLAERNHVFRCDKVRNLIRGPNSPAAMLTQGEVDQLFQIYGLPQMSTYDTVINEEQADGSFVEVRPFPSNKVVLLPPPQVTLGRTLWGPTAESRGLAGTAAAVGAPGPFAVTYNQHDPPSEWIKGVGVSLPSIPGANLVAQVQALA